MGYASDGRTPDGLPEAAGEPLTGYASDGRTPDGLREATGAGYSVPSYCCLIDARTAGSASVVVSPRTLPSAISRSRRRMILALRVLGSSAVKKILSGLAIAPIFSPTWSRK